MPSSITCAIGSRQRSSSGWRPKDSRSLNWADGGWVYAFARSPVRTPDDLRARKLFTSAGDPESERLYKRFGFRVVPLSLSDLVTSLQTGMIDAFTSVPLFALLNESYKLAPHMTDVRWAPLVGGTVISVRTWERIPQASRAPLLAAARSAGDRLRADIRKMDADAVKQMESRGLKVAVGRCRHPRPVAEDRRGRVPGAARRVLPRGPLRRGAAAERRLSETGRGRRALNMLVHRLENAIATAVFAAMALLALSRWRDVRCWEPACRAPSSWYSI